MHDLARPTFYVVCNKSGRLVEIDRAAVARPYQNVYKLHPPAWRMMVSRGDHLNFGAHLALRYWRQCTSGIAVVQFPQSATATTEWAWCVCFNVAKNEESSTPFDFDKISELNRVLWPLDADDARDLYARFAVNDLTSSSTLLNFPPGAHVDTGADPRAWQLHPLANEVVDLKASRRMCLFLSSIVPYGVGWVVKGWGSAARRPLRSSPTPDASADTLRGATTRRRSRSVCAARLAQESVEYRVDWFEWLPADAARMIVYNLADEYVRSTNAKGHANWRALRSVNATFRDEANRAAINFVSKTGALVRSLLSLPWNWDVRRQHAVVELRSHVLPTGVDTWTFTRYLRALRSMTPPNSQRDYERILLLCYMRFRGRKALGAMPPPPPYVVMVSNSHGSSAREHAPSPTRVTTRSGARSGARSSVPVYPTIRFKLHVETWRAAYMTRVGWSLRNADVAPMPSSGADKWPASPCSSNTV